MYCLVTVPDRHNVVPAFTAASFGHLECRYSITAGFSTSMFERSGTGSADVRAVLRGEQPDRLPRLPLPVEVGLDRVSLVESGARRPSARGRPRRSP